MPRVFPGNLNLVMYVHKWRMFRFIISTVQTIIRSCCHAENVLKRQIKEIFTIGTISSREQRKRITWNTLSQIYGSRRLRTNLIPPFKTFKGEIDWAEKAHLQNTARTKPPSTKKRHVFRACCEILEQFFSLKTVGPSMVRNLSWSPYIISVPFRRNVPSS